MRYDDTSLTLTNPTSKLGKIAFTDIDFGKKVTITFDTPVDFSK
jgi:hypothetical protein